MGLSRMHAQTVEVEWRRVFGRNMDRRDWNEVYKIIECFKLEFDFNRLDTSQKIWLLIVIIKFIKEE